jgi:hypothetical protein
MCPHLNRISESELEANSFLVDLDRGSVWTQKTVGLSACKNASAWTAWDGHNKLMSDRPGQGC